MSLFKKKKILVTHNGSFHADDIFAAATLSIYLDGNVKIIRTRDKNIIAKGDYVFDVGGVYDPKINRFDHHQKGGAGERENGIPYAAFGLVWKHFGLDICGGDKDAWEVVDKSVTSHIDCVDNGVDFYKALFEDAYVFTGDQNFLINFPTWDEDHGNIDQIFIKEVKKARNFLERKIAVAKADTKGKNMILESYNNADDKRIVMLNESFPRYLYQKTLSMLSEPVYIVMKSSTSTEWKVEAVVKNPETLESRKPFPESWRGLLGASEELKNLTGIDDVLFCHKAGFLMTFRSKEGALKLAKKALEL